MKGDKIKPLLLKLISYKVSVPRVRHASCNQCKPLVIVGQ